MKQEKSTTGEETKSTRDDREHKKKKKTKPGSKSMNHRPKSGLEQSCNQRAALVLTASPKEPTSKARGSAWYTARVGDRSTARFQIQARLIQKRLIAVSAYPSVSGGVFACEDDVCEAPLIDDALVEGRWPA